MFTASDLYGTSPVTPTMAGPAAPTQQMAVGAHDLGGWKSLLSVQNPLTWFAGFLLVTVGAAGVSGSARLGRAKVSGAIGS